MPTYEKPKQGHDIYGLVADLREQHYPDLEEAEVTISILFAYGTKNEGGQVTSPAISANGYPAAAQVKINPLKSRAEGLADATIIVDGDEWEDWDDARCAAVLDHELHHLEVMRNPEDNSIKSDDLGRPRLKMKKHDFHVGWFAVIAQRHGKASLEVEQAMFLADPRGQLLFPWCGEGTNGPLFTGRMADRLAGHVGRLKDSLGPDHSLTISSGGRSVTINGGTA